MQVLRFDDKLHDRDSLAQIYTLSVMAGGDLVEALGGSPERSRRATRMQDEHGGIAAMLGYHLQIRRWCTDFIATLPHTAALSWRDAVPTASAGIP
jgi:hypothetical protein